MKTDLRRPLETSWEDWTLGGGARACFADPALPLEVEIGPGEDDALLLHAQRHPDRNWLGIEYSRKRVKRYVRRVLERDGALGNLRLAWRPAADVIRPFLTPARVDSYHVYFPDPWPKKHHHRYRLLTPAFLGDLRDSLVPGGEIRLATDHRAYAEAIVEAFEAAGGLENLHAPPGFTTPGPSTKVTVFEDRWRAMGRTIHALRLRRPA